MVVILIKFVFKNLQFGCVRRHTTRLVAKHIMCTYQFYVALLKPFEDFKVIYTKKRKKARFIVQDHVVDICSFCLSSNHLLFVW